MKGLMPLIIALILIAMITLATIHYTTTMVTYNASIAQSTTGNIEWVALQDELRSMMLTTLRKASQSATLKFIEVFLKEYGDDGFIEDPNRVITRTYRSGSTTITRSYIYYKYSYFSSTTIYANTRNPSDLYKLYLKGYNMSRSDFIDALTKASREASKILMNTSQTMINNWVNIRVQYGYRLHVVNHTAYYITTLSSNPNDGSIGVSRIGLNLVLDVYSPWSGYKRFNETIEVYLEVRFKQGIKGDTCYYIPLLFKAYVYIGGERTSYILDPDNIVVKLYSKMFHRWGETVYTPRATPNGLDMVILGNIAGYYYGDGYTQVYYSFNLRRNRYAFIAYSLIYNTSLSDPSYDDEFKPPLSEDVLNTVVDRHTMTFFIGGLITTSIDNIYIATPLQLVFSYLYDTNPPPYDWLVEQLFYGDPGQVRYG